MEALAIDASGKKEQTAQSERQSQKARKRGRKRRSNRLEKVEKLLSYQKAVTPTSVSISSEGSDSDDTKSNVSHCSPDYADFSDSDSSEESVPRSSGNPVNVASLSTWIPTIPASVEEERFVSVFWDIENCPVPSRKSAVDFVKKVRDTFYDGRTEESFVAACDTRILKASVEKELCESRVTVVHVSSENKNAADSKLQQMLQQFQFNYRLKKAAVVLVTGDADFAPFLNEMRYKHQIYVNLVCTAAARKALKVAAHKCILYEEFLSDLPDRCDTDDLQYYLIVSNLPSHVKHDALQTLLKEKVKSVNCKVKIVSPTEAEVSCSNHCSSSKALRLLEGFDVYGSKITVLCGQRKMSREKKRASKHIGSPTDLKPGVSVPASVNGRGQKEGKIESKDSEKRKSEVTVSGATQGTTRDESTSPGDSHAKSATLYVFVSSFVGDSSYWEKQFKTTLETEDLSVQWTGKGFDSFMLLKFKSVSKAQKAKKLLELGQRTDPQAPTCLKLVKGNGELDLPAATSHDFLQATKMKFDRQVKEIKAVKKKRLVEFQDNWNALKQLHDSAQKSSEKDKDSDKTEFFKSKLNVLNEQKVTFLNFTETVSQKLHELEHSSEDVGSTADELLKDYFRESSAFSCCLPIYAKKTAILKRVKKHQVVIVQGEAGSGKSTQLCQYLWRDGLGRNGMVICSQPTKVAAVTLAKHACSQLGCSVGNIVGYQIGLNQKRSPQTKVLYATDVTLLEMCSKDPLFKEAACIVVDEADARTIYTDLLLAVIKRCLKVRKDLKLIISVTSETNLFQKYFGVGDEAVFHIPQHSLPVETIWLQYDVNVGWDYFDKTVSVVHHVLMHEPEGDVLAFLATASETEKAVRKFNELVGGENDKSLISVLNLHEKSNPQELHKIFQKTPADSRKVVFATEFAATALIIPGIKYVIDSGMVMEEQYNSEKGLNVISIGFETRASTELRRRRAGHLQNGKCYRLYSQSNYEKDMADDISPEITRVDLSQALIILIAMGVKHPSQFDFLEQPSADTWLSTTKQLFQLEAVKRNDFTLTEIGNRMAFLPLHPRFSYIVLKGVAANVGFPALVSAAFAETTRSLDIRIVDDSHRNPRRGMFSQPENDFVTYLEIYNEWLDVPKAGKLRWCALNNYSAVCLQQTLQLVTEVLQILSQDLFASVPRKCKSEDSVFEALNSIMVDSFCGNICVFSGNSKLGYLSLDHPESLHFHPASSLRSLKNWPEYVVCDTVMKIPQAYLLNAMSVSESSLQRIVEMKMPSVDFSSLRKLTEAPYVLTHLGQTVLKTLAGESQGKNGVLGKLSEITSGSKCAVSTDFQNGQLTITTARKHHSTIEKYLRSIIEKTRHEFVEAELETENVAAITNVSVAHGAGYEVKEVILPGECRSVKITPPDSGADLVVNALKQCGKVVSVTNGKKHMMLTFQTVSSVQTAVQMFRTEKRFNVKPVKTASCDELTSSFFTALVRLLRRPCTGVVLVGVKPKTSFESVAAVLMDRRIVYKNTRLEVDISETSPCELRISGVPKNVVDSELKSALEKHLPPGAEINKFIVERKQKFVSKHKETENIKQNISNMFSELVSNGRLHVDLKFPKANDEEWVACVSIENPHEGENAVAILKQRKVRGNCSKKGIVSINPVIQITLSCDRSTFNMLKVQIEDALRAFEGSNLSFKATCKTQDKVFISISGNAVTQVQDISEKIQNILQGDQLQCNADTKLEKLFTKKAEIFLKALNSIDECQVHADPLKKVVSIFGTHSIRSMVKTKIVEYLDNLEPSIFADVSLRSSLSGKSIVKEVVKKYGHNLNVLCTSYNLKSANIRVRQQVLTLSGEAVSIEKVGKKISKFHSELGDAVASHEAAETCPVCCDIAVVPSYRLECCGHAYCPDCVVLYLQTADDFPIICCQESCERPIVIQDIQWAFKRNNHLQKNLSSKALRAYMMKCEDFKFCAASNCSMIHRVPVKEKDCGFTCPSCSNSVCRKCSVLFHHGMSCEMCQTLKNCDDLSWKGWLRADPENHGVCTPCKFPVERHGLAEHAVCWSCKRYLCWLCMHCFSSIYDVSTHRESCPVRS